MSQTDTKTRIMDAAEQLFARDGFHSTSLRGLTELANVNLAAVNYHFGSKEGLLQAVFARRLLPLNKLRQQTNAFRQGAGLCATQIFSLFQAQ